MPNRNTAQVTSTRRPAATKLFVSCHPHHCVPHALQQARARRSGVLLAAQFCALLAGAGPVLAAETSTFGDEAMAALQTETRGASSPTAYEVNSLVLPNLGDASWNTPSQRQGGTASSFANATQHIDVTRWLTPDAPRSLGFSLGLTSAAPLAGSPGSTSANSFGGGNTAAPTSLDLGVRWRSKLATGRHLDVSAWAQTPQLAQSPDAMGLIWQQQQPVYGTRVEMQWASSKTRGLVPEFGAIGVQLQGGSRLVLRARKGGPMLYYRAKF